MNIEDRMRRLESEGRTWRVIAMCLALAIFSVMACSRDAGTSGGAGSVAIANASDVDRVANVVRSKAFELIDDHGAVIGRFYTDPKDPDGDPRLELQKAEGKESTYLGPGGIVLSSDKSMGPVRTTIVTTGSIHLKSGGMQASSLATHGLRCSDGSIDLGINIEGFHMSEVTPEARAARESIDRLKGLLPSDELIRNSSGRPLVEVRRSNGGGGMIDVYNALGKVVVSVQANKSNDGTVYVDDASGKVKKSVSP